MNFIQPVMVGAKCSAARHRKLGDVYNVSNCAKACIRDETCEYFRVDRRLETDDDGATVRACLRRRQRGRSEAVLRGLESR